MRIFFAVFFSLFLVLAIQAQEDEMLAREYMGLGEYDKAAMLYEDIYKKKTDTYIYDNYLTCLIKIEDWKTAEKISSKKVKSEPEIPRFRVDYGYILLLQEKQKEAKKEFESAIDWAKPNVTLIIDLAAAFQVRELDSWTLEALEKGKKEHTGNVSIIYSLANLHYKNSRYEEMYNEYFSLLESPLFAVGDLEKVLQDIIMEDVDGEASEVFKVMVLKKLQKDPASYDYTKLLIWYYVQMLEFDKAVVQANAFERRSKGDGEILYDLAVLCISNRAWGSAEVALQDILNMGDDQPYYFEAKQKMLEVKYEKLTTNPESTVEDLNKLALELRMAVQESQYRANRFELVLLLSSLEAYFLNETDNAIDRLQKLLNTGGYSSLEYARAKLLLGDVMIVKGEVWEASLLYSQVEKALKYDTIGYYAKFKNAQLYYFLGEFDYAAALLDILRGATSKLIANDAMRLSLLIQDNVDYDSSYVPLQYYARADMLDFAMKYEEALSTLDTIIMTQPGHPIIDEAIFKKALIYTKLKRYDMAISMYKEILSSHYNDVLGDNALMNLARLYENQLKDVEKAKEYYLQLVLDFPGSVYVEEARKHYRILRGDNIN
jgi:tetratricopeptide (TPR) repeat protein